MLPAPFEYHRPGTLEEALQLLAEHGEDAKVLAGGQSLIPLMKLRFAAPARLIDINRIAGLDGDRGARRVPPDRRARPSRFSSPSSDVIKERYPTIAAAAPMISDPIVRNLGTIGGSLAHADPSGDLGLGDARARGDDRRSQHATASARSRPPTWRTGRSRARSLRTSCSRRSACQSPPLRSGGTYLKFERKVGDFATVAAAIYLTLENGSIGEAGIGLTSVGLTNLKADGRRGGARSAPHPATEAWAEAGRLAAEAANPITDVRGSAEYKRHMVEVYVRRGLAAAAEMAGAA